MKKLHKSYNLLKTEVKIKFPEELKRETLLHLQGGVQKSNADDCLSFQLTKGGKDNGIEDGCQTKSFDNINKSASGHQQIGQWASSNFPMGKQLGI